MLSTLFPPDPTLAPDNISCIMEKVEPKVKMHVWNSVLEHSTIKLMSEEFSFKEEECADIYVNCNLTASWDDLAQTLYEHHQMAAVKEARSYLPPRGEPHFGVLQCFNFTCVHVCINVIIVLTHTCIDTICIYTSLIIDYKWTVAANKKLTFRFLFYNC